MIRLPFQRIRFLILAAGVLLAGSADSFLLGDEEENWAARFKSRMTPALEKALADLKENDKLDVYAVMLDRLAPHEIEGEVAGLSRKARAQALSRRLMSFAERSQAGLRDFLKSERTAGKASQPRILWIANAIRFQATGDVIRRAARLQGVGYLALLEARPPESYQDRVSPSRTVSVPRAARAPGGTLAGTRSIGQNLIKLQAYLCWINGVTGQGVVIVNIDSGVDYTHPDLVNQIWDNPGELPNGQDDDGNGYVDDFMGWDFIFDDNDPYPYSWDEHGTATAGIVCGDGTGGIITGMAPDAQMAVARVAGEGDYWEAQQYAVAIGADVITSSYSYKWEYNKPDYHMFRTCTDMELAAGIIHSNSIGNQGDQTTYYPIPWNISTPGNCPGPWIHPDQVMAGRSSVLGVSGIYLDDTLYTGSGQGPSAWEDILLYDSGYKHSQNPVYWDYPYGGFGGGQPGLLKPDVCAYTFVTTTDIGGGYDYTFGGTSGATPHVGGAFCLMLSANPHLSPRKISQALQETAEDMGTQGKDLRFGAGKIQVADAILRTQHSVEASTTQPSLNSTLDLRVSGIPGETYRILCGLNPGRTFIPWINTAVDLGQPFKRLFYGVIPPGGETSHTLAVSGNSALVGLSVYFQGIENDIAGPYQRWLVSLVEKVTVQP